MEGHEHFEELLSSHLDGELDEAGERELEEHLESCPGCREVLELLEGARAALSSAPEPPEDLAESVMSGVRAINRSRRSLRHRYAGIFAGLAAAAAVLAVVILPKTGGTDGGEYVAAPYALSGGIDVRDGDVPEPDSSDSTDGMDSSMVMLPGGMEGYSLPKPEDMGTVEDLLPDYAEAAWFAALPEGLEYDFVMEFPDGTQAYVTSPETLAPFEPQAERVEFPNPDGTEALAIVPGDGENE